MSRLIKDKYRVDCLISIGKHFAHTSRIKDRIEYQSQRKVKQSHILSNLKQLEKDGYVKKKDIRGLGGGYWWELTGLGLDELAKLN